LLVRALPLFRMSLSKSSEVSNSVTDKPNEHWAHFELQISFLSSVSERGALHPQGSKRAVIRDEHSAPSLARGFLIRTGWGPGGARCGLGLRLGLAHLLSAPRNRMRRGMSAMAEPALGPRRAEIEDVK